MALVSSIKLGFDCNINDRDPWCESTLSYLFHPLFLASLSIIWEFTSIITLLIWYPDPIPGAIGCVPLFIYVLGILLGFWSSLEYNRSSARIKSENTWPSINSDDNTIQLDEVT